MGILDRISEIESEVSIYNILFYGITYIIYINIL